MTNSEWRLTLVPRLIAPPGEAMQDWEIGALLARHMGYSSAFGFTDSQSVFEEYKSLTAHTPVDIRGVSDERLRNGSLQWPCPAPDHPARRDFTSIFDSTPRMAGRSSSRSNIRVLERIPTFCSH